MQEAIYLITSVLMVLLVIAKKGSSVPVDSVLMQRDSSSSDKIDVKKSEQLMKMDVKSILGDDLIINNIATSTEPNGDQEQNNNKPTCMTMSLKSNTASLYHCHTCRKVCQELADASNVCLLGEAKCSSMVSKIACTNSTRVICKRVRSCTCILYHPLFGVPTDALNWDAIFGSHHNNNNNKEGSFKSAMPSTYAWCSVLGVVSVAMAALSYMVRSSQKRQNSENGDGADTGNGIEHGSSRANNSSTSALVDDDDVPQPIYDLPPSYQELCSEFGYGLEPPPPDYKELYPEKRPSIAGTEQSESEPT